jgi:hypothetical protein
LRVAHAAINAATNPVAATKEKAMRKEPAPRRGMPRSLIYAMIPLGFLLLVMVMVFVGDQTSEDEPGTIVDEPVEQPLPPPDQVDPAPAD